MCMDKRINIFMSDDLYEKVKKEAQKNELNISAYIRMVLRKSLDEK